MTQRINATLEAHPSFGWIGTIVSFLTTAAAWLVDHADEFTKIMGVCTALMGFVIAYYTLRIQRRAWKKAQNDDGNAS